MDANFLAKLVQMAGLESLSKPLCKRIWNQYRVKYPDMRTAIHLESDEAIAEFEAAELLEMPVTTADLHE